MMMIEKLKTFGSLSERLKANPKTKEDRQRDDEEIKKITDENKSIIRKATGENLWVEK